MRWRMLYLRYEHRCDADGCDAVMTGTWQRCQFPDGYQPQWEREAGPILPKGWRRHGVAVYCPRHTVTVEERRPQMPEPDVPRVGPPCRICGNERDTHECAAVRVLERLADGLEQLYAQLDGWWDDWREGTSR